MTGRFVLLLIALTAAAPATRGDDAKELLLNEKYKGTTKVSAKKLAQPLTTDLLELHLKSGQRVEILVEMVGERDAAVAVWDQDNEPVKLSWPSPPRHPSVQRLLLSNVGDMVTYHAVALTPKTARLVIPEVPATAKYTVTVHSSKAGDYTILAKDGSKKRDATTVRAELEAAKKRVTELEKELQTIEKK